MENELLLLGRWRVTGADQRWKGGLAAGERCKDASRACRGTLEQGTEVPNAQIGPHDELGTQAGVYPAFTCMQLGQAPASLPTTR